MKLSQFLLAASVLIATQQVSAHFQMIQADDYLRDKGGKVTLSMPFTHPSHGSPMMAMDKKPLSFTLHHHDQEAELTDQLQKISWSEPDGGNSVSAWQAETKLRKLGDYVFSLEPAPYYEKSEDKYIQQYTKVIYNVGGLPTSWDQPTGAKYEIIPDLAPYAVYAGGLFSGVVLVDGKPYPDAEIEVEYLNHALKTDNSGFEPAAFIEYPNEHMNILTIKSDANGRFFFVPPVPGYWGFAALDLDDEAEYEGKELSQDAVLWIQAHELKRVQ